ncbi:response regulator transcription factor [Streptomyces sp. NPDC047108]|uniref:response regulator n=1 Tax=Streptomyces sp. NPDC047108 TaxID=3155025 RepID=UPI0033F09E82
MIRVLVADDEPLIRTGITTVLDAADDIQVVGVSPAGHDAREAALRYAADVVLVGLGMPEARELRVIESLLSGTPPVRIVLHVTFWDRESAARALALGCSGVLMKGATPADLIASVRAAAADGVYVSREPGGDDGEPPFPAPAGPDRCDAAAPVRHCAQATGPGRSRRPSWARVIGGLGEFFPPRR